jgi:hypothetical protein
LRLKNFRMELGFHMMQMMYSLNLSALIHLYAQHSRESKMANMKHDSRYLMCMVFTSLRWTIIVLDTHTSSVPHRWGTVTSSWLIYRVLVTSNICDVALYFFAVFCFSVNWDFDFKCESPAFNQATGTLWMHWKLYLYSSLIMKDKENTGIHKDT